MAGNEKKFITLEVGEDELRFKEDHGAYGTYIDTIGKGKLRQGSNNFCVTTVHKEDLAKYRSMVKANPGVPLQLAGTLADQMAPDLEVAVKKQ